MYILATALLILGTLTGAVYGFIQEFSILKTLIYCFAGGFAGSAAGGVLFTLLYLKADTHENAMDDPSLSVETPEIPKRLPQQVQDIGTENNKIKIKRLEQEIRTLKNKTNKIREKN